MRFVNICVLNFKVLFHSLCLTENNFVGVVLQLCNIAAEVCFLNEW